MRAGIVLLVLFSISSIFAQQEFTSDKLIGMSLEELMNVEITTAGKKAEKVGDIPASVVIVTRADIEKYGYSDLAEIIDHITGIYLWDGYHPMGKTPIGVRGYAGTDNMIIMVNGVNQVEGLYDRYILPRISVPVEAIDRIEVVRGPMSVLYGSGAFFGAINIITNDTDVYDKDLVSLSVGNYGILTASTRLATAIDEVKLVFTGSFSKTDGIDKKYTDLISNKDYIIGSNVPIDFSTEDQLADQRTFFNVSGKFKNLTVDLTHSEFEKGYILTSIPQDYSPMREQSTIMSLNYDRKTSDKFRFTTKFTYNTFTSLAHYFPREIDSYVSFGYNSSLYELEANGFWDPSEKANLTFGVNFRNVFSAINPFEGEAAWGPAYSNYLTRLKEGSHIKTLGVFAQGTYTFSDKFSAVLGLRLEKIYDYDLEASGGAPLPSAGRVLYKDTFSQDKMYLIPRVALIYKPHNNHFIKFLYGEALKHPSIGVLADNLSYASDDSPIDIPTIKSSKIQTFEINYTSTIGKIFLPSFSIFWNYLDDLIFASAIEKDGNLYNYTGNTGKINTTGVEVGLKIRPIEEFEIDASLMYQDSENKSERAEGMKVAYSPEYIGYIKISYLLPEKIRIAILGKYIDDIEAEYNIFSKTRIANPAEGYFVLNANIRKDDFINKGMYIQLKVNNLLDENIIIPADYTNAFADKGFPTFGRTIIFKFGYAF